MKILTTLACLLAAGALAADSTTAPLFQLRRIAEKPGANSEQMTIVRQVDDHTATETLNVEKAVLFDQSALKSATAQKDLFGHSVINVSFTKAATEKFADYTRQNVGARLGIVINGRLCEAPVIRTAITGGQASISGSFTAAEARDLAAKLNDAAAKSTEKR